MAAGVEIGIAGVEVGHWTDEIALTGCTVVTFPEATVASGEIRGGAPATRDFELLQPGRLVEQVDAVVLSGGSAFGLAAVDGVVEELETHGRGFPTRAGVVPIVVGLSLFDLGTGDATVRPRAEEGRAAYADRTPTVRTGRIGAGTGATVGKWQGPDAARPGGLGAATVARDDLRVAAIVAVNGAGDVDLGDLETIDRLIDGSFDSWPEPIDPFANTSIGVVVTNAAIDKGACHLVAQSAHDGLARALVPAHTRADGDAFVAAATGEITAGIEDVRLMSVAAVVGAIRTAVGTIQG